MDMRKIAYAALIAAASMSAVATAGVHTDAPAPAPSNDAITALPVVGSLVGASVLSFFALYMH
ncbi:hypothetical protein CDL12_08558 [Handroanthus impetiginosus]|uniref:Arabinogalactan peptide 23-like n=1 Tax=Handroanthus impetiginosus TaxID=429701 RepID=A0A2G9HMM6_9LAMI|nr:hypothetical protein CDL12_08558 [Handroanthus impetiginosus]